MKVSFFKRVLGVADDGQDEEVKVEQEDVRVTHIIRKEHFVLDKRYKPLKKVGKGAYGMVISAKDREDGDSKVAIKKNVNVFQSKTCAKRILREIKLLSHFDHPNIIRLRDIINPLSLDDFDSIYLVLDYMQSDLHRVIYSENKLTDSHVAYVMYQILCGVKYMHSAGVYHRDLKPSNVLVNSECQVKICDFGLARGVSDCEDQLTEYVVTRWYRAPEVVLNARKYGAELDVWSIGCILAELYYRRPVFRGEDYADQLKKIFRIIGNPSPEDVAACVDGDQGERYLRTMRVRKGMDWEDVLPSAPKEAIDLLSKLLMFNPEKRLKIDEALQHPFFAKFYDEDFVNKECVCEWVFNTDFEKMTRRKDHIRMQMMEEIRKYRPDAICPASGPVNVSEQQSKSRFDFIKRTLRQTMSNE